jgi:hypothetical protein
VIHLDALIWRWLNANPQAACNELVAAMLAAKDRLAEEASANNGSAVFRVEQGEHQGTYKG